MTWLAANDPGTRYLVAAQSNTANSLTRAGVRGVIAMGGGFQASDPTPTVADLERLVQAGALAYVYEGAIGFDGPGPSGGPARGPGGGPGGAQGSGLANEVQSERDVWITEHCSQVAGAPNGILRCRA